MTLNKEEEEDDEDRRRINRLKSKQAEKSFKARRDADLV